MIMAGLMATMAMAGPALAAGGGILSAAAAIGAGHAAQQANEFQAAQLDAQGLTEQASAQRQALEEHRQSDLAISRARVVGAASGGGQDLPLLGQIEEDGELRRLTALWQGDEAAKGRSMQADAARYEGNQAMKAGYVRAGATILSSGAAYLDSMPQSKSFLDQYG